MTEGLPHICFVAPYAYPILAGDQEIEFVGGAEVQQVSIAKGLAERGYRVSMICLDYGQKDQIEIDGIRVYRAFDPTAGVPVLRYWWPRLTSIWRCLKRVDADIYYQRAASMLTGVMALFCRLHNRKSVFAAAGNPNFERNTTRIRFQRDRWIYEYGLRNVDRIVVQNREQATSCLRNFGRDSTLMPSCCYVRDLGPRDQKKEVLWVSRIRTLKRPGMFLDIAAALPEVDFKMIGGAGAGPGEERLFEQTKHRAEQLDNVKFLGFVPYSKIDTHFRTAAIFVNTSESEGFPNTFLQAWAQEVPTLSFVDCGARLDDHPIGRVVQSTEEMIKVIRSLMSNVVELANEGKICRDYVSRYHSLEKVLDLYELLFAEMSVDDEAILER